MDERHRLDVTEFKFQLCTDSVSKRMRVLVWIGRFGVSPTCESLERGAVD